ncbi:hypothetical protein V8E36_003316 [Tilletia maclaganii]
MQVQYRDGPHVLAARRRPRPVEEMRILLPLLLLVAALIYPTPGAAVSAVAVTTSSTTKAITTAATYLTNTKCTTKYGTLSRPPPIPTTLRHNATTVTSRSSTTVTKKTTTRPPAVTVTYYTGPWTYSSTSTLMSTWTVYETTASPSTTVYVPTPTNFHYINPASTISTVCQRELAASIDGHEACAPVTQLQERAQTYPQSVLCTDQVTKSILQPVTTVTRTSTVTAQASKSTVYTKASTTMTYTEPYVTETVVTSTRTIQPTIYAACATATTASTSDPASSGPNYLSQWIGPPYSNMLGAVKPINAVYSNGEISNDAYAYGPHPVSCCSRCQESPTCVGSAWVRGSPSSNSSCILYTPYDYYQRQCGTRDGVYHAATYYWDPSLSGSDQAGAIVISNGPCGPWTQEFYNV